MPTARYSSSSSTALWPAYYPPALGSLSDPRPHPEPAKLPPSVRYRNRNHHRTLQDELDQLDNDEDLHYNQVRRPPRLPERETTPLTHPRPRQVYDLRQYGHSWLVPLGRQRTHDEEVDVSLGATVAAHSRPVPDSPLFFFRIPHLSSHDAVLFTKTVTVPLVAEPPPHRRRLVLLAPSPPCRRRRSSSRLLRRRPQLRRIGQATRAFEDTTARRRR